MADEKDNKISSPFTIEPTPEPNKGASEPQDVPLTSAPIVETLVADAKQTFADAVSGAGQRRNYDMLKAAAGGDPAAQAEYAQYAANLAAGTVQTPKGGKPYKIFKDGHLQSEHATTELAAKMQARLEKLAPKSKFTLHGPEAVAAEKAALDMSQEARAARAKEMGFDPDQTLYHGTGADIDAFRTNPKGANKYGEGVYMTKSANEADRYAGMGDNPNILPVHTASANPVKLNDPAALAEVYETLGIEMKPLPSKHFRKYADEMNNFHQLVESVAKAEGTTFRQAKANISSYLQKRGYTGISAPDDYVEVVFDPKHVRSKFAEFDPAKKDKNGLSFADGGEVPMEDDTLPEAAAPVTPALPEASRAPASTPPPAGLDAFLAEAPQAAPGVLADDDSAPAGLNEFLKDEMQEAVYGTPAQQVRTGVEGAVDAATFGLGGAGLDKLGLSTPEERLQRAETNPGSRMVGQGAGLVGSALIPGVGAANLLGKAGQVGAAALRLGASPVAKIGSAAVAGLIENALFQGTDEVAKMIMKDPNQSVESALLNVGLSGLIGGGVSGAIGTVPALWAAASGKKLGGLLDAIVEKAGGREGASIPEGMSTAIQDAGMDIAPEIKAGLSDIPEVRQMFKTLEQSDTTGPGLKFQETYKQFRQKTADDLVEALGATSDRAKTLPSELSRYEAGKAIGDKLAAEYERTMAPLSKEFETLKARFEGADLVPRQKLEAVEDFATGQYIPEQIIPGTADEIAQSLGQLVEKEGWMAFPDGDIIKTVNQVYKALPRLKTVKDLTRFVTKVGEETASTLPFGQQTPLSRAGSLIKNVLKDAEEQVALKRLGEDAPELVERFHAARGAFKAQAALKEALDDRLKVGGSVSGYAKGLREMAKVDGEKLLQRLSGAKDADGLKLLAQAFPETASLVKQWHTDNMLKHAAGKATKYGEAINVNELLRQVEKMEPELRNFALSAEQQKRIGALTQVVDELEKMPHNFSNTARTADKLNQFIPGTAVGLATMLLGHNPAMAVALGFVTKLLAKDVPDAARLGLLKFLGSSKPVEAEAFKAMVDFMGHTIKGQNLLGKASKGVFTAGREVIPAGMMPKDEDRQKLDRHLKKLQKDEAAMMNVGGKTGHYMPDTGAAIGQVSARVVTYLNSLRPEAKRNAPLDPVIEPPKMEKDRYNRALDIAEQPLVIAQRIKDGTLTSEDVQSLQTMYPSFAAQLRQKLTSDMIDHVNAGEEVPYGARLSLSLFLGQPLDSTMKPEAIMAAQAPQIAQQQNMAAQDDAPPKKNTGKLGKSATAARTPAQAREAEKSQGK